MDDAAGRGHPLHIARLDGAAAAGGIAVRDLALIGDGDGLEAAMGVLAHAARLERGREMVRPGIVEQQEGAVFLGLAVIGKQRADGKAVAHPMAAL
jgi:hypothetical protein